MAGRDEKWMLKAWCGIKIDVNTMQELCSLCWKKLERCKILVLLAYFISLKQLYMSKVARRAEQHLTFLLTLAFTHLILAFHCSISSIWVDLSSYTFQNIVCEITWTEIKGWTPGNVKSLRLFSRRSTPFSCLTTVKSSSIQPNFSSRGKLLNVLRMKNIYKVQTDYSRDLR